MWTTAVHPDETGLRQAKSSRMALHEEDVQESLIFFFEFMPETAPTSFFKVAASDSLLPVSKIQSKCLQTEPPGLYSRVDETSCNPN